MAQHTLTAAARPSDPWPNASVAPPVSKTFRTGPADVPPARLFSPLMWWTLALLAVLSCAAILAGTVLLSAALRAPM